MSASAGFIQWKLANVLSPIILTGGIATQQGGAIPIIALTDRIGTLHATATSVTGTLAGGGSNPELDGFFANYQPVAGAMLIANQVATYPFANQAIAANAIIAQPLPVSMLMICPATVYSQKLSTMIALQNSLAQHNNLGGTYSIITASYIYTDCIMTGMRDVSGGESKQPQYAWQLDFMQPLVALAAAQQALNGLMQKLSNGTPISGTPTWSSGLPVGNPTTALRSSLAPQPRLSSP